MKLKIGTLRVVLAALVAMGLWIASLPAMAEEVFYSFDFEDGQVPESLRIIEQNWGDVPPATLSCDASSGYLRVSDPVPGARGMGFVLDELFSDSHLSMEVNSADVSSWGFFYLYTQP